MCTREWAEEVRADNRLGVIGKAQVSSPNGDRGWDVRAAKCSGGTICVKGVDDF